MAQKTQWMLRNKEKRDEKLIDKLVEHFKISDLTAKLLINRGCEGIKESEAYLNPSLKDLHDPFLLLDMEKSIDRIIKARDNNEKICLYGDYDADGTTGVSILYQFLKKNNFLIEYFIPNRMVTGYGLHIDPLEKLIDSEVRVLITVDNGISATKQVEFCNARGVDVIITDHHECHGELPKAYGIINPKRPGSTYPFTELCGAGVAFKLVQALDLKLDLKTNLRESIECVALATVADLVPLKNENRALVSLGLDYLNSEPINKGIKALMEVSDLSKLKAWHFGFVLGPKINAAGRLGEANKIVELLTGDDPDRLMDLAIFLSNENKKRQDLEQENLDEALKQIKRDSLFKKDVLVIFGEGWHPGVIGIVASKIQEIYYCPVIVIAVKDGIGKGSCRSIDDFNIFEALSSCKELFTNFGGHALAAGFTIPKENILKLRESLNLYGEEKGLKNLLVRKFYYDENIKPEDVTWENLKEVELFEPCGLGNPSPQFVLNNPLIYAGGLMGKKKEHLYLDFEKFRGVGFNLGDFLSSNKEVKTYGEHGISILCRMDSNDFRGKLTLQLSMKDIKKNPLWDLEEGKALVKVLIKEDRPKEKILNAINDINVENLRLTREDLLFIFSYVKQFGKKGFSLKDPGKIRYHLSFFHVLLSCEILREAKIIRYKVERELIFAEILPTDEKKDIQKTKLMIKLKDILKTSEESSKWI